MTFFTLPTGILLVGFALSAVGTVWTLVAASNQARQLTQQSAYIAHQDGVVTDLRTEATAAQVKATKARDEASSAQQSALEAATLADKRKSDNVAMAGYVKTLLAQLEDAHKADATPEADAHAE